MGELSIAQQIPTYISTLTNTLINLFSPNLTMYYAKDDTEAVVKELKLSMKFSSFFVNIIFCGDHDESSGFRCNNILKQRIPCDKQVEGEFYFLVDHQFY